MYGKLVDGVLQTPPVEISRNIKQMKDAGYKPVIDSKPGFEQPDSTNPYMKEHKVRFEGKVYQSTIDNNVWSPTAYPQGWEEVNEVV